MNWTKEIPTVDGYYWVRCEHIPYPWIDNMRDGCVVRLNSEEGYYTVFDYKNSKRYEFFGPLEEPE